MCEVQIGKIIITTMAIMMVTSTPTEKLTSPWEIADQCQCGPDTAEEGSEASEGKLGCKGYARGGNGNMGSNGGS